MNPGRGLEVAIEAMDGLPDCELWIAGSGPEEADLRRLAGGSEYPGRVRFLGFVAPEELPALTEQAWLGLNLLDAVSPSYYYSLANKALDYVQAGVPSVQMDFPEYRAINREFGCYALLTQLTVEALAAEIDGLVRSPARYEALREGCAAAGAVLCWEKEQGILLDLWMNL